MQAVKSLITLLFWLTPILWSADKLGSPLKQIILANPIVYIITGYRNTFVNQRWFFQDWQYTIYFWAVDGRPDAARELSSSRSSSPSSPTSCSEGPQCEQRDLRQEPDEDLQDLPVVDRPRAGAVPRDDNSKKFTALKNVTMDFPKGEVIAILGKNGSGKSTLLKIITGVATPDERRGRSRRAHLGDARAHLAASTRS